MTRELSDIILKKLAAHYGDARPDLKYTSIYQLAVAVVLSAQTTDVQVNRVTPGLFTRYPDLAALAAAKTRDVERIIKSTGFYHNKAKNIVGLARAVMKEHGGKIPSTREALMSLPGVGRKSANVILSVGFGIPALAVDTHIIRIAGRLGYTGSDNPLEVEKSMVAFIPEKMLTYAHLALIKHGRALCRARNPLCPACPVIEECCFDGKSS